MTAASDRTGREAHRRFLNAYYGATRHIYDVTRRYYLFGRDRALRQLLAEPWERLIEVGIGTGRNVQQLARARPSAELGGLDASDVMLDHVRSRQPHVRLAHGFAEDADLSTLLSARPDRILFSYCLSMVGDPRAALENARRALAPGGRVVVVDFADFGGAPRPIARLLQQGWLERFHVKPVPEALFDGLDAFLAFGPGRYYLIAEVPALPDAA